MTPDEFIARIGPAAHTCMADTGISAAFTIAQGALESAWGGSGLCRSANNLFGVKADLSWTGDILDLPTRECIRGQWVTVMAHWRKYNDWQHCIEDHAQFFTENPRYATALESRDDPEEFARLIQIAGYATDPDYAHKIAQVIHAHGLKAWDDA